MQQTHKGDRVKPDNRIPPFFFFFLFIKEDLSWDKGDVVDNVLQRSTSDNS